MICPRCKTLGEKSDLQKVSISGIEVDICQECGGIWFDKQEFGQVISASQSDIKHIHSLLENTREFDKTKDVELECPKCGQLMFKYRYMYTSNIYIDSCEKCEGIWIDKGELLQIIEYLDQASKVDPEKEAAVLVKLNQIKLEYQQREKEFIDSLVRLDDRAKNPTSKAFGEVLQSIYSFLYKKGL